MNYLAHAYLSFNHPEILVGNMISDFVKGRQKLQYPSGVQKGIILHRLIDEFTDAHSATRAAKEVFRPVYRLYSAAFIDIVYDHFLATDQDEFREVSLEKFSESTYIILNRYTHLFPDPFARMFPYMQSQNWLYNYRLEGGIQRSFGGLVRRAAYLTESEQAFTLFRQNYELLKEYYTTFFKELKSFTEGKYQQLVSTI